MALPTPPPEHPSSTPTTRPLFPNPPLQPPQSTNPRPISPSPLPHYPHPHLPQQQQIQPHYPKIPPQPPQHILYPVASSGRGFIPKPTRPIYQNVSLVNPIGYPSRPLAPYHQTHSVRPFGFNSSDPGQGQLIRPNHNFVVASTGGVIQAGVVTSKVAPTPSAVSDSNGYKDSRGRSRDDTFTMVRDRKVKVSDGASLYVLCRSWLRNGFSEESQTQSMDGVRSFPRPLPIPVGDAQSPVTKEGDKEEEEEDVGSVEHLSSEELLQRHVKRAKKVRARLREERLHRIARYKTRLALLLPPIVEQHLRNDMAAGN